MWQREITVKTVTVYIWVEGSQLCYLEIQLLQRLELLLEDRTVNQWFTVKAVPPVGLQLPSHEGSRPLSLCLCLLVLWF